MNVAALNSIEIMNVPQAEEKATAVSLLDRAKGLRIYDEASRLNVGAFAIEARKIRKDLFEKFDPIRAKAHEAYQEALKLNKEILGPVDEAIKVADGEIARDHQEQERIRLEQQRRLREAEEARAREEARLQQEELDRQHALQIEAELEALPVETPREVVAEICERAAPEVMPIYAPTPVVPRTEQATGISVRMAWSAEITDLRRLCKEIAEGRQPTSLVEANMSALNRMASALKEGFSIPGVRAVSKPIVAGRR